MCLLFHPLLEGATQDISGLIALLLLGGAAAYKWLGCAASLRDSFLPSHHQEDGKSRANEGQSKVWALAHGSQSSSACVGAGNCALGVLWCSLGL